MTVLESRPRAVHVLPVLPVAPTLPGVPSGPAGHPGPLAGTLGEIALDRLPPVSLAQVLSAAALQTRVDRKYLVPVEVAHALVGGLRSSHSVLRIEGRLATTYGSAYLDTPDRAALRAHAQGRRRRWKVRTRLYREDLLCRLEVKTDVGGTTVKHALDVPAYLHGRLDDAGRTFVRDRFARHELRDDVDRLVPSATVDYARATLCDLAEGTRLTIDADLVARPAVDVAQLSADGGPVVRLRPDHVLVETKGGLRPSTADAVLLRHGVRPVSVSKYSLSLSLLEPHLPGTRWRPAARRWFLLGAA